MAHNIRKEVQDLMRVSEKLIQFAHMNGELNDDECDAILYYAQELEREVLPFCKPRSQSDCGTT